MPGDLIRAALRYAALAGSIAASIATAHFALASGAMPREAAFMAAIFVLAALLWMTEALPLFATSLLVIGLQLILLANPGGWAGLGFESGSSPGYRAILQSAADPVLLLFFGGFLLARAAVKEGVDRSMSALLLKPFGDKPRAALAGVLAVTALFSMFMSNTATAAMMVALVAPMLAAMPKDEPFRRALMLAVAFAASVGGMGTPIGSPPNAVAVGHLQQAGLRVTFLEWMLVAVPLVAAVLALAWWLLWRHFGPRDAALRFTYESAPVGRRGWFVVTVFAVTVLLWLSDRWHGLPASVVALLPAIALTTSRTLNRDDLNSLQWNVLILIAGGLALGEGMSVTGLDRIIVSWLPLGEGGALWALAAGLVAGTLLLSTFMSNTAAANLLLPIGISAAASFDDAGAARFIAMNIALAAAMAMALPISTPPNAIVYARGEFSVRELAKLGVMIGAAGAFLILLAVGPLLWLWGVGR